MIERATNPVEPVFGKGLREGRVGASEGNAVPVRTSIMLYATNR